MKKILMYTMIMTRGGTENTICNLANNLIDEYEITIVTNIKHICEYDLDPRIKYTCIDKKNKKDENFVRKIFTKLSNKRTKVLSSILEKEKPDLIMSFLPEASIRALAVKTKIPVIVAIRNHPTKEFRFCTFIRDHYYKKASTILVQDHSYIKYLNKNVRDKTVVIPNFISQNFIDQKVNNKKEKIIMTATRLEKQKNVDLLLNAFAQMDKRYNSYRLVICGDGSLRKKLERKVEKLKISDRVVFRGRVHGIKEDLAKAQLFILPSNYEGMPNVVLEAMSCSTPVISTRSTEVIESIINDGIDGIIINKNDIKELVKQMERILDDKNLRMKMQKNAKEKMLSYSEEKIIKNWKKVIRNNIK